jgi:glutamate dehydrogenase
VEGDLSAGAARLRSRIEREFSSVEAHQLTTFASRLLARGGTAYAGLLDDDELMAMVSGASAFFTGAGALPRVRVFNPHRSTDGWQPQCAIVEVCLDDGPFVVETVSGFIRREGFVARHVLHPVFVVRRERDGGLIALHARGDDGIRECLLHIALAQPIDPQGLRAFEARLGNVVERLALVTRDQRRMYERLAATAQDLEWVAGRPALRGREADLNENVAFLRWLAAGNFVLAGYTEDQVVAGETGEEIAPVFLEGLGVLRPELAAGERAARVRPGATTVSVSRSPVEAPVHPFSPMDVVRVHRLAPDGQIVGAGRFVGLFTPKALAQEPADTPLLRRMLAEILAAEDAEPASHDARELVQLFNGFLKEDLFRASAASILSDIRAVRAAGPEQVTVTARLSRSQRGQSPASVAASEPERLSVVVSVPASTLAPGVRDRIERLLAARVGGAVVATGIAGGEGARSRLHVMIEAPRNPAAATDEGCVREITGMLQPWQDRLRRELAARWPAEEAERLAQRFRVAFPGECIADADVGLVADHIGAILELERTRTTQVVVGPPPDASVGRMTALRVYELDADLVLSDFIGVVENLGLRVFTEEPLVIALPEGSRVFVHALLVQDRLGGILQAEHVGTRLEAVLRAVQRGEVENDVLNGLVLTAGLDVRAVDGLRMLAAYAYQIGLAPNRDLIRRALADNPGAAGALFQLFAARFDHEVHASQNAVDPGASSRQIFLDRLDEIPEPGVRAVVRRLGFLVEAVVRTNFFGPQRRGPCAAIKVDTSRMPEPPRPGPAWETFVHGARIEGLYVRTQPTAAGAIGLGREVDALRRQVWETLGPEEVRHAATMTAAARGLFVVKDERPPSAEAVRDGYAALLRALLDVADGLVEGRVCRPEGQRIYDGDDPFLVVTAGEGTAGLADLGNAIAAECGFWLGDAFAPGGPSGYDARALGIAARGAWECVRAHLRDAGRVVTDPVVVIGAGDMTDDFFSAGMLASQSIRLRAALSDHYVFVDPDPDPEATFAERQRLARTRQGWEAYDASKLSRGGMILARSAKRVALSPEVRVLLGLGNQDVSGERLAAAILSAEADVLWTGGAEAAAGCAMGTGGGELATADSVPVRGRELRAAVIAEGSGRGLTSETRIEYARSGGRMNSFAVDSTADVDLADYEVCLKVLLQPRIDGRTMTAAERVTILRDLGEDVVRHVMSRVRTRHRALTLEHERAQRCPSEYTDAASWLEGDGPPAAAARRVSSSHRFGYARGRGTLLTRPELGLFVGAAKLRLRPEIAAAPGLVDDSACARYLLRYFPPAVRTRFADPILGHGLRREIAAAEVANALVDTMGATFVHRTMRDTGATAADVCRAWVVADTLAGGRELLDASAARADAGNDPAGATIVERTLASGLERLTLWVLRRGPCAHSVGVVIDELTAALGDAAARLPVCFSAHEAETFHRRVVELEMAGLTAEPARQGAIVEFIDQALDAIAIGAEVGAPWERVAGLDYALGNWLDLPWLLGRIEALDTDDVWQHRAAQGLVHDLGRARARIVRRLAAAGAETVAPGVPGLPRDQAERVAGLVAEVKGIAELGLAPIQVIVRELGNLTE